MSVILGLDCDSAKIGYAYLKNSELWKYGVLKSVEKDRNARQFDLFGKLYCLFDTCFPDKVILEQSFYSNNFKTSQAITEVIGAAKIICQLFGVSFETIAVTSWKKKVLGKGSCNKKDVADFISKKYPQLEKDVMFDVTDAIAIGLSDKELKDEKSRVERNEK